MSKDTKQPQLIGSSPLFHVRDLFKSLDYYCDVLGFTRPRLWGEPPGFAMPFRDGYIIMLAMVEELKEIPTNHKLTGGWDAYFWVTGGVETLFEEFKSNGAIIHYEPQHKEYYGHLEFAVLDPDGYLLAFGEDAESA